MSADEKRLREIWARLEDGGLSPGPWRSEVHVVDGLPFCVILDANGEQLVSFNSSTQEDAEFIAAAREDVPWLLALVDEMAWLASDSEAYRAGQEAERGRVLKIVEEERDAYNASNTHAVWHALNRLVDRLSPGMIRQPLHPDVLRRDNDRMRAALRRLADWRPFHGDPNAVERITDIAREALEADPE